MCDQDHFEDDRKEYEALGLVTRKQFGVMLGAGVAMMLPQVANAAAVTEMDVSITTPDGTADCYFVHPSSGHGTGGSGVAGHFRVAAGVPQMGKRLAESGYSVLVVNPFYRTKKAPTAERGRRRRFRIDAARANAERDDRHDGCEGVHRMAGQAGVGRQKPEDGDAGVLHGRSDGVSYRGCCAGSRRGGCVFPWRRTGDGYAEQSASAGCEEQGAVPDCDCGE